MRSKDKLGFLLTEVVEVSSTHWSSRSSGEASPTIWSCYANISVFIDCENNQFLKKWIMIII
jgi:hypothetical protein